MATEAIDNLLSRISIDPNICHGKPCIKGHRIWVSLILDLLAGGTSIDEILEEYPGIEREDIFACLAYGAEMTKDSYGEITLGEKRINTLIEGLETAEVEGKLWIIQ